MVGQWFKERFQLIGEELGNYQWKYKQWTQKVTAPSRRAYEYVINQDFRDGNVEFEGDIAEQQLPIYAKRKGYIVWYSGENYGVRREVAMEFWLSNQDLTSDDQIRSWMDEAIRQAMTDVGIDSVQGWNGFSYRVENASGSELRSELSDFEYKYVNWTYKSNDKLLRDGTFQK